MTQTFSLARKFRRYAFATLALLPISAALNAAPTPGFNNEIPENIMTPDRVETRIGTLNFFDGMPDAQTVETVYEHLDFIRGVEVFLNFIPLTSVEGIRMGMEEVGCTQSNQCLIFDQLMDSNPLFLTGNTDTVYASIMLDLKNDGPTVVEIPPKCGPSTVNDAFFRFVTDMGIPGPDRGASAKYLILPPDYEGELSVSKEGEQTTLNGEPYYISQSTSYVNWLILRGLLIDGKPDIPTKTFKEGLKVYPLSLRENPPEMEFIRGTRKVFNTIHANTFPFYEELAHVLEREPLDFIDPELRGLAASIGIRKGKPFEPDEQMKTTLIDAIAVGNATARSIWLRPRDGSAYLYEDSTWYTAFMGGSYEWLADEGEAGRYLDARTMFFYMATVNTPAMVWKLVGKGSQYALNCTDKAGNYLKGSQHYKLNIPSDVPAKDFWSVVAYDPQTRSELQTDQPYPSKNSVKDKDMVMNADGSYDLYFGPTAPAGKEANWIQTVPGKGWFTLLRLYGPLEPWFERTWQPGEFELLK